MVSNIQNDFQLSKNDFGGRHGYSNWWRFWTDDFCKRRIPCGEKKDDTHFIGLRIKLPFDQVEASHRDAKKKSLITFQLPR